MAGKILERDERGRIVKKSLSSEEAREIGSKSQSKRRETSQERILIELGWEDPNDAPELEKLLAAIAAGKSAGAVSAMRELNKLVAARQKGSGLAESEVCPYRDNCLLYQARGREFTEGEVSDAIERTAIV